MLFSYLKIAFRNLVKKRIYSIINILGLSVGAAASLIIFLYVQGELSYDQFLPESNQIYRVVEDRIYPDHMSEFAMIPWGFATVLPEEISEVKMSTRLFGFPNFATVVRYKDKIFSEHYFFAADSNFFDVFPFKLLKGNSQQVLRHTNTLVLTASTATKYFGDEEPIGKTMKLGDGDHEVVGVMEDVPPNSHFKFDALGPTLGLDFIQEPNFYIAGSFTYVKLIQDGSPEAVNAKLPRLVDKYAAGQIERNLGVSYAKYIADGNGYRYFLQPIKDIHLESQRTNEIKANGNKTAVTVLIFVGILIMLIAGINFVNLATARSAERAREVGVRKVLGSKKAQLIMQFLSESVLITVISTAIAIVIIQSSIGYFSSISETKLQLDLLASPLVLLTILTTTLCLGLVAGLYPAFYIASLKPVQVLKGKLQSSSEGKLLRNGLVIFQFTVSVILISATMVVYNQLDFIQQTSLGFEKENLLVINNNSQGKESNALQQELKEVPGVQSVGSSSAVPGGYFFGLQFRTPGSDEIFTPKGFSIDDNFASTLNLQVIAGRSFGPAFNDSLSLVINEKAAAAMRLDNPIGAILVNNINPDTAVFYTIVGVVKDFNYESLRTEITPLIIMSTEGQLNFQSVLVARLGTNDFSGVLKGIEAKWKEIVPDRPFIYSFMDSQLDNLYASEKSSGKLLTTFTFIAIIVACVGLFGLAAYTANQRTKEIGVRKVLGATVLGIIGLLSRDFAKLVLGSLLLGAPIAWLLMRAWLQTFAYRVSLDALPFMLAGGIVLLFTLLTISYQAIRAAMVNPVNSLKDE